MKISKRRKIFTFDDLIYSKINRFEILYRSYREVFLNFCPFFCVLSHAIDFLVADSLRHAGVSYNWTNIVSLRRRLLPRLVEPCLFNGGQRVSFLVELLSSIVCLSVCLSLLTSGYLLQQEKENTNQANLG